MESNSNKKKDYIWGMFMPLITMVLVQFAMEIFTIELVFVYKIGTYKEGAYLDFIQEILDLATNADLLSVVYVAYSALCIIIFSFYYIRVFSSKDNVFHPFREITSNVALFVVGVIVFSVAMQYVCNYCSNAVAMIRPDWLEEYESLLETSGLTDSISIPMAIYACLLAPVCEELAFRGLTYKYMRKCMPATAAIILQAAFFAGFHQNMFQATYTFVVGLGLGYVMYKYDNILVPILIHMLYNFFGTFVVELLPLGGDSMVEYFLWLLGSLIMTYGSIVLLSKAAPASPEE